MSRDMKGAGRNSRPAAKKSGGGMLVGIFIGLILGVAAALGVALYINKTPMPFQNKAQPAADKAADKGDKAAADKGKASSQAPLALPGKPGDPVPGGRESPAAAADAAVKSADGKPAEPAKGDKNAKDGDKPRFDFYKILPGGADNLPEPKAEPKRESKDSVAKEPTYLQAGSFQKAADAESVKANLALMGLDASVQQVMVQDKVWFRVRLGPYAKPEEASKVRADLAKSGIETTVVKNKE